MIGAAGAGSDPFGGLTGYKRDISGNPTSLNGQLPSFRGVKNTPGQDVKAGPIKSSSNHPTRKTNILIPYTRVIPLDEVHDVGRLSPGDLAFVSSGPRANLTVEGRDSFTNKPAYYQNPLPGYTGTANAYMTKLVGLDYINKHLGNGFTKLANLIDHEFHPDRITARNCLIGSDRVGDEWRAVPFLQEWTPDGIVLSSDAVESYYGSGSGAGECQVFNIGIQGPCPLNNGYEDAAGTGALTRPPPVTWGGSTLPKQSHDSARNLAGPGYHQYPLQMFDRKPAPMMDCMVGLIATAHYGTVEDLVEKFPNLGEYGVKKLESSADVFDSDAFAIALANNDANAKAGGASKTMEELLVDLSTRGKKVIHTFRFECFSSRQAQGMNPILQDDHASHGPGKRQRNEGWRWEKLNNWWNAKKAYNEQDPAAAVQLPDPGERPEAYKGGGKDLDGDRDLFIGPSVRDFRSMVGAWRLGKVMDTRAFKGEYFDGGPTDTGYRLTINMSLEWLDWRALRRRVNTHNFPVIDEEKKTANDLAIKEGRALAYTYGDNKQRDDEKVLSEQAPQIGDRNWGSEKWKGNDDDGRILQWPTAYHMEWSHCAKFSRHIEKVNGFLNQPQIASGPLNPDPYEAVYTSQNRKGRSGKPLEFMSPPAGGIGDWAEDFSSVNGVQNNPNIPTNPDHGYSYRGYGGENIDPDTGERKVISTSHGYMKELYPTYMPSDSAVENAGHRAGVGTHHTKVWYGNEDLPDLDETQQRLTYFRAAVSGGGVNVAARALLKVGRSAIPVTEPNNPPDLSKLDPNGFSSTPAFGDSVEKMIVSGNYHTYESNVIRAALVCSDLYSALTSGYNPNAKDVMSAQTVAPRVAEAGTGVVNMQAGVQSGGASSAPTRQRAEGVGATQPDSSANKNSGGVAAVAAAVGPLATARAAVGPIATAGAAATPAARPAVRRPSASTAAASAVDAVFSSILGGSQSAVAQPLNPAHHSAGPAGSSGAATGASATDASGAPANDSGSGSGGGAGQRSFPRRKRGGD